MQNKPAENIVCEQTTVIFRWKFTTQSVVHQFKRLILFVFPNKTIESVEKKIGTVQFWDEVFQLMENWCEKPWFMTKFTYILCIKNNSHPTPRIFSNNTELFFFHKTFKKISCKKDV